MAVTFETPWHGVETAGRLCLSFVNTLDWRLRESPEELLHSAEDLLRWARTAGALTGPEARLLRREVAAHPRRAARMLAEAVEVREAMAAVFLALCRDEPIPPRSLKRVSDTCIAAVAARELQPDAAAVGWGWRRDVPELERPTWAAALDAADLLSSGSLDRLRLCDDDACGWLFMDTSKNRSRRWCSMADCGNRNKARSFYRRSRARA